MRRSLAVALILVFAGCGSGPNGTLTVTVEPLPTTTREVMVQVQGTVSRTPSREGPIVVVVAGGQATVQDSLSGTNGFAFDIALNRNTENQLAITASDATGVVSEPVVLVIYHDDTGPVVDQMVPGKGTSSAALDTPIEVVFTEPLFAPGGAGDVRLLHNATPVAGSFVLSADARKVTFTPAETLQPNSVYELQFIGYEDQTGNTPDQAGEACFVTTASGFPSHVDQDTADVGFLIPTPEASLVEVDLRGLRLARRDSTLFGVIEFAQARAFGVVGTNSGVAYLELDTDQSSATGFTSIKDTIFVPFPDLASELGVEMLVGIEPNPDLGDSAYVGRYTAPLEFDILDTFLPGTCGRFFGFHTTALLDSAGDDGAFDYTLLGFAFGNEGDYVDPMPESGHYTADVTAVAPAAGGYRTDIVRPRIEGRTGRVTRLLSLLERLRRR